MADPAQAPPARRALAEGLGAALLVAIGSGAATVLTIGPLQRLEAIAGAGGPVVGTSPFESLVANSLGDVLGVALAFALVLAVLIYALGGVSGAHFNPAVTIALALRHRFPWREVPLYIGAQCAGAVLGAFGIAAIYGQDGVSFGGQDVLLGAPSVADGVGFLGAIAAEGLITFLLMFAIMAVAVDPRAPKGWTGLVIGIALGSGILATGAATGGSANFARSLGPLVASLPFDYASLPWGDLVVYALGPVIGAAAAAFAYEHVAGLERATPAPQPGAATPVAPPSSSVGPVESNPGARSER